MAKVGKKEIERMKEAPCYPGSKLIPQEDGSYLVVPTPCPPDCYCSHKCTEDEV